jgi:hypothetical protein
MYRIVDIHDERAFQIIRDRYLKSLTPSTAIENYWNRLYKIFIQTIAFNEVDI